jgi:ATP adenylyltransferase
MKPCLFCNIDKSRIVSESDLCYAIADGFPVTKGHTLVIPRRHAETYFDLTDDEVMACNDMLRALRKSILALDPSVKAFNVGMNAGEEAGQTIFHCHIHLIPRRAGDVENPRGGIRHVIPGKGYYQSND